MAQPQRIVQLAPMPTSFLIGRVLAFQFDPIDGLTNEFVSNFLLGMYGVSISAQGQLFVRDIPNMPSPPTPFNDHTKTIGNGMIAYYDIFPAICDFGDCVGETWGITTVLSNGEVRRDEYLGINGCCVNSGDTDDDEEDGEEDNDSNGKEPEKDSGKCAADGVEAVEGAQNKPTPDGDMTVQARSTGKEPVKEAEEGAEPTTVGTTDPHASQPKGAAFKYDRVKQIHFAKGTNYVTQVYWLDWSDPSAPEICINRFPSILPGSNDDATVFRSHQSITLGRDDTGKVTFDIDLSADELIGDKYIRTHRIIRIAFGEGDNVHIHFHRLERLPQEETKPLGEQICFDAKQVPMARTQSPNPAASAPAAELEASATKPPTEPTKDDSTSVEPTKDDSASVEPTKDDSASVEPTKDNPPTEEEAPESSKN